MKIFGGIILALALSIFALPAERSDAAACSNVSSFGAVTLEIPKLPMQEGRVVWLRLEAPSPQSHVLVQINDDECLQVGGHEQPVGQWGWQTARGGEGIRTVVFPRTEGNTLKVIGVSDGVKVDRVVVTGSDCVPQDFGANCQHVTALREGEADTPVQIPSPTVELVRGKVLLSPTPEKYKNDLKSVAYIEDGRTIQESTMPKPFDTTRTTNGKHTIQIVTTLEDGTVIRESTVIDIDNPQNILSPLVRWAKLHSNVLLRVSMVVLIALVLVILARLLRSKRHKHRERRFHGF